MDESEATGDSTSPDFSPADLVLVLGLSACAGGLIERCRNVFRIKPEVCELGVFSTQNISNPAFIKLDLLSCRNLLIDFDTSIQQRLLPMFQSTWIAGSIATDVITRTYEP